MSAGKLTAPNRRWIASTAALLLLLAAGCGYRGPLYLPPDDPAEGQSGQEAEQAATEEEDPDRDEERR